MPTVCDDVASRVNRRGLRLVRSGQGMFTPKLSEPWNARWDGWARQVLQHLNAAADRMFPVLSRPQAIAASTAGAMAHMRIACVASHWPLVPRTGLLRWFHCAGSFNDDGVATCRHAVLRVVSLSYCDHATPPHWGASSNIATNTSPSGVSNRSIPQVWAN